MERNPKYRIGDLVSFNEDQRNRQGLICTVDDKSVYSSSYEPEYDIFVEKKEGGVLYRHVHESAIHPVA